MKKRLHGSGSNFRKCHVAVPQGGPPAEDSLRRTRMAAIAYCRSCEAAPPQVRLPPTLKRLRVFKPFPI